MAIYFYPNLMTSIVLSIVLSIGLTLFLNLVSRKKTAEIPEENKLIEEEKQEPKSGGFILIGPIPIVFGNDGLRFDKNAFKWALLFFTIIILTFLIFIGITYYI